MKKISEMNLREVRNSKEYTQQKISNLEEHIKGVQQTLYDTKELLKQLINKENQMTSVDKPIIISDHAVLRFLERVHGIDIEAIKQDIRIKFESSIKCDNLADGIYWDGDLSATVREKTIVTVYKDRDEKEGDTYKEDKKMRIKIAKRIQKEDEEDEQLDKQWVDAQENN